MSSKTDKNPQSHTATIDTLHARVEDMAARLMLGNTDGREWAILLASVCQEAEIWGKPDVARIASESLMALPEMTAGAFEAAFSVNIAAMQQALAQPGPVPVMPRLQDSPPVPTLLNLGEDPEMIGDFILESREHLTQVEIQMMTLEKEPGDSEAINTVFRGFHTIKGLAGFLDFGDVREVAHETETLLDLARNHKLRITPAIVDIVLAAADFVNVWLQRLETTLEGRVPGPVPPTDILLERIRSGAAGGSDTTSTQPETVPADRQEINAHDGSDSEPGNTDRREPGNTDRREPGGETRAVKVDTAKLDALVDMAGEMVIAQSLVRHHPELAALRSPAVLRSLAQLARTTGDLQKTAMSMRMVPVGGLFQRMSRLVRDLARKTNKQAEMEAIGGDTELDRHVVEELADPLMHMVRNAADHGLEPAEERRAAGKDPTGRIRLRASHQAGHIVIEIADDGRGLIRENILAKARRTGLVDDGDNLSDSEVFNFIFQPGFSTAAKVTDVSGRGVGMDVVKKQIQKLRGRVEIESVPGKGTSFFLRLPLTLAMIDGLVVGVGDERYIIPIFSVREMLRPTAEMVFTVENRQEMALVRGALLPIIRLYRRFKVTPRSEKATDSLLIVAEAAGKSFCLMVDELICKQEVVIKSLGESLRDIPGVAGGAILGDGRVGLILDLEGIFRLGEQVITAGTEVPAPAVIQQPFGAGPLVLTATEFDTVAALARNEFGLELGKGKEQLVASRLGKVMRQLGFTAFRDYYAYVQGDRSGDALVAFIDALTTNHTSFFREQVHFDFLQARVLAECGRDPVRIWSAASSTGEEPYTIALTAREYLGSQSPALPHILATDICTRVLETARKGMYRAERFDGKIAPWLKKHLLLGSGRWEGWYRMRPEILAMVEFMRLNLIEPQPDLGLFRVIFCRNVMIYFSRDTQAQLVNRLAACLEPGGYLFVGHSESLTGMPHGLEQVQPAVYRKRGGRK